MKQTIQVMGLLVSISSCTKTRELETAEPCRTWKADIQPLFEQHCVSCHGKESARGGYDLSAYATTLGGGADAVPNVIAGDPSSALLAVFSRSVDDIHSSFASDRGLVEDWIVRCQLAYEHSRIHEPGLMNPSDESFHGALLASTGYDFSACAKCHGDDFDGGTSNRSCKSCHHDGPTSCSTCHDRGVKSGLHQLHLEGGPLGRRVECSTCHVVPNDYRDRGHLGSVEVLVDFDRDTQRCSVRECHGTDEPSWRDEAKPAECGSCHGLPPSDHASPVCKNCHPGAGDRIDVLVSNADHLNGVVELGRNGRDCERCHQVRTERSHRAHLEAPLGLSAPIGCETCHLVPAAVDSPGHIDTDVPAEVFPAAIAETSLAFSRGALPLWDAANGTCSSTYCHGSSTIGWRGTETIACGSCHAIPPSSADHEPTLTVFDCSRCHMSAIDPTANVNERHVNGRVDL